MNGKFLEHLNSLGYGKYDIEVIRAPKPAPWQWISPDYWVDKNGYVCTRTSTERVLYFHLYDEQGVFLGRFYSSNQILEYILRFKVSPEMRDKFLENISELRRTFAFDINSRFKKM